MDELDRAAFLVDESVAAEVDRRLERGHVSGWDGASLLWLWQEEGRVPCRDGHGKAHAAMAELALRLTPNQDSAAANLDVLASAWLVDLGKAVWSGRDGSLFLDPSADPADSEGLYRLVKLAERAFKEAVARLPHLEEDTAAREAEIEDILQHGFSQEA